MQFLIFVVDINISCKMFFNQLTSLINLSIDTGVFPDSLKKSSGNTITQEK